MLRYELASPLITEKRKTDDPERADRLTISINNDIISKGGSFDFIIIMWYYYQKTTEMLK